VKAAESQKGISRGFTHWELELLQLPAKFLDLRDTKNRFYECYKNKSRNKYEHCYGLYYNSILKEKALYLQHNVSYVLKA
jgi:hypothetical protein